MLHLENVSKTYGPTVAVKPLDLTVPRGSTTVLIGQSGCGKSTLLRMMIGLIQPDPGGRVEFDGQQLTPQNVLDVRLRMGYVIQDGGLFPHLTARNNVTIMARHQGWSGDKIQSRIDELVSLVHLEPKMLDRYPRQLSGGQRQRVSLMRALMLDPEVLLLDEPLGALDPIIRRDLQEDLREIFRQLDKTVVLVTHDMGEAAFFSDHILVMLGGQVLQQGPIEELLNSPADPFVSDLIQAQRSPLDGINGGPKA